MSNIIVVFTFVIAKLCVINVNALEFFGDNFCDRVRCVRLLGGSRWSETTPIPCWRITIE